jgi:Mrp family chromosome partitioning ATPase
MIVLASFPAGVLLGCLAALLSVRLAGPRRVAVPRPAPRSRPVPQPSPMPMPQPVAAYSGPPILADIPGALIEGAADHVIDWPASPFARAVSALLMRVAPPAGGGRIVSVTVSTSGQAGTTVALALARAAAKSGLRTILVDGNVQKPAIARLTGVRTPAGLIEVLRGSVTLNRALTRDPRSAVLLLSSAAPSRDPAAALASPRMAELFAHLRRICDLVIVAAPPVQTVREAPYFTKLSDAVVMVARPEEGPGPNLPNALRALAQWRSPPVGMVLVR